MKKSATLIVALLLLAGTAWGQAQERNMVVDGLISGMESTIGDLTFDQEDQFIAAYNQYVSSTRQGTPASKSQALQTYQNEVKRIVTPQKYAILSQNPKFKNQAAFKGAASTN